MTTPEFVDSMGLAVQLYDARQSASPAPLITARFPDLPLADARAIARFSDELRRDDGETQIGWKLGWTSQAMRTALGIDQPNWGTLWDTQVATSSLCFDDFIHPKIEPELVWRSPVDFPDAITAAEVRESGGSWALGLEVVDPRFPSFNFTALDNTADNSSSAAVRLGGFSNVEIDLAAVDLTFSNGSESRTGAGNQAMGSPFEAVAWLSRSLAEENLSIRAGDIVFTGGITAPFDVAIGSTYEVSAPSLETTTLRFT